MNQLLDFLNRCFKLSFNERNLEDKYQSNFFKEHRHQNILVAKIAIIIYLTYAPVTYAIVGSDALLLTGISLFSISCALVFLYLIRTHFFEKYYYWMLYFLVLLITLGPYILYTHTSVQRRFFEVDIILPLVSVFTMLGAGFSLALLIVLSIVSIFFMMAIFVGVPDVDLFSAAYVLSVVGALSAVSSYMIEKTKRKVFMERQRSEEFQHLVESSNDMIAIFDKHTLEYLYVNQKVLDENNYTKEEILGKTFYDIHPNINLEEEKRNYEILLAEGSVSNVLELYKKNGEKYYVHVVSQLGQYHAKEVIISVASDVTELKKTELKIRAMALHDSLTQLYNRYKFDEFCSKQVEIYNRYKTVSSLIICDIDYFKNVNDTYGHLTGDEVLKSIAKTIQ